MSVLFATEAAYLRSIHSRLDPPPPTFAEEEIQDIQPLSNFTIFEVIFLEKKEL